MVCMNRRRIVRRYGLPVCAFLLLSTMTLMLSGCGSFFQCEGKASCPGIGPSPSPSPSTVNYAYVANSVTGSTYINGYTLASGSLTPTTGAPYLLGHTPSAMAVTPSNTILYIAASATASSPGAIYGYTIGTGGALTILSSNGASELAIESTTSIDISPDGKWLFALNVDGITLDEYSISTSTGFLTPAAEYNITGAANGVVTPASVKVAPTGNYIVVALGTAGAETFAFNTSTGLAVLSTLISPSTLSTGIYAVAVDSNNYLYCVGTAGLQVFSTTTAGAATFLKTYTTGKGAHSLVVNGTSTYVYVGNEVDSTISGYAIGTSGALTALTGSPYPAPTTVTALARDSKSAYVIASGYDATSGIQLFSIGSTGALTLTSSGSAGSGTATAIPGEIAATH